MNEGMSEGRGGKARGSLQYRGLGVWGSRCPPTPPHHLTSTGFCTSSPMPNPRNSRPIAMATTAILEMKLLTST